MPHLDTAQEWLTQSTLLLQARPTTTRITTKYTITPLIDPNAPSTTKSSKKERKPKPNPTSTPTTAETTPAPAPAPPPQEPIRATLTLKTYDAASHTSLKYSTTKAAEVSRLIQILGRLGRGMAGLPEKEDAVLGEEGVGAAAVGAESAVPAAGKAGGQGGAVGKKGKKKGKK